MERQHAARPDQLDVTEQIVVVGVVAEREAGVRLVTVDRSRRQVPNR